MKRNPTRLQELEAESAELEETLESISSLADEALDPELTREQLVGKLKEISELSEVEAEEDEPAAGE